MAKIKRNKEGLSNFEENFLNIWFNNGFNGSDAYTLAKPGCAKTTAATEAAKILVKPYIVTEIAKRKLALVNRSEIKLDLMVSTLKTLMYDCISDGDRANLLKTIDVLNKMAGFYTQKVDVTSQGDKIAINLNLGLDIQEEA